MARKKLRRLRTLSKRRLGGKTGPSTNRADSKTPAQPAPEPTTSLTRQDIVSKLISLCVPSARDARKNAEKAIENVFSAVRHALSEGELIIADFGEIKASADAKGRNIHISFTPDEKLKQAVEARLNAPSLRQSSAR
jgi:nucleoid DNA-binding protein